MASDDLRTRLIAAIAAHEPVTDYDGADGECIECDLNPRWPDAPILPPSDGWKRHAEHLADAVIRELDEAFGPDWLSEDMDARFIDFGEWLAEEITGKSMSRIDLESCLADWKGLPDA